MGKRSNLESFSEGFRDGKDANGFRRVSELLIDSWKDCSTEKCKTFGWQKKTILVAHIGVNLCKKAELVGGFKPS